MRKIEVLYQYIVSTHHITILIEVLKLYCFNIVIKYIIQCLFFVYKLIKCNLYILIPIYVLSRYFLKYYYNSFFDVLADV